MSRYSDFNADLRNRTMFSSMHMLLTLLFSCFGIFTSFNNPSNKVLSSLMTTSSVDNNGFKLTSAGIPLPSSFPYFLLLCSTIRGLMQEILVPMERWEM